MSRWAIWAAVSSLPQVEKISLISQLELGREHAAKWSGAVVAELIVPGESRSIVLFEDACRRIEAYAKLRDLIESRAIDVLCYLDRSRLGRKASLSMTVVELCHEADITTYDLDSPPATLDTATSHDDMLVGAIKSVGAQQQIIKLMDHHRRGMIDRVERGELPSGLPPYGYVLRYAPDGSKVVEIDDTAANRVRQMMDWYLAGAGHPAIATRFNEVGIPGPMGGPWREVMVKSIIYRAWRYAGYGEVNRKSLTGRPYVRAKGNWPSIIDEETAERVFAEQHARNKNRYLADTPYILSGLVYCIHCDRPLVVSTTQRNRPSKKRQMQLRCMRGEHPHRDISYLRVMAYLHAQIEALGEVDLSAMPDVGNDKPAIIAARIASHERSLDRLQASILRADDAYIDGRLELDRYDRQVERLQAEMAEERRQMAELATALEDERSRGTRRRRMADVAADGLAVLDSEDHAAANAWLRARLRIWVDGHTPVLVEWL